MAFGFAFCGVWEGVEEGKFSLSDYLYSGWGL